MIFSTLLVAAGVLSAGQAAASGPASAGSLLGAGFAAVEASLPAPRTFTIPAPVTPTLLLLPGTLTLRAPVLGGTSPTLTLPVELPAHPPQGAAAGKAELTRYWKRPVATNSAPPPSSGSPLALVAPLVDAVPLIDMRAALSGSLALPLVKAEEKGGSSTSLVAKADFSSWTVKLVTSF
jgi:hypothetical protein